MKPRYALLLLCLAALTACKGTEDYLLDLHTATDSDGRLKLEVFDAGQLVHEALTGLTDQEVLTLSQMGRGVHFAGVIVQNNRVPLCRADAVTFLSWVALHYPVPAREVPYDLETGVQDTAREQILILAEVTKLLGIDAGLIPALSSPDLAVADAARTDLEKLVGEDLGPNPDAWTAWWNANEPRVLQEAVDRSSEPLRILAGIRYRSLSQARAVLGFISTSVAVYDLPEIRPLVTAAIMQTARQVIVFGIIKALGDPEISVRLDAAVSTTRVLDNSFGKGLVLAFERERDADVRAHQIRALASYPSKQTVFALMRALGNEDRQVVVNSLGVLEEITGEALGEDAQAWELWWEREGKTRWP